MLWDNVVMATKLLLVEDDEQIRQVLSLTLADNGFEVTGVANGEDAVAHGNIEQFELAVVDLRLPGINGIEVVRALRNRTQVPIVILTAHGESEDVIDGLGAGADDFLKKPIAGQELVARLGAILRRTTTAASHEVDPQLTVGGLDIFPARFEATVNGVLLQLTRTEFGVLRTLAERSPETVSRQVLLESVWGYDYLGDSRLVDMQIYRLRQKLEGHNLRDKLLTVRSVGFRLVS